jgi:putative DNA primase/helicase
MNETPFEIVERRLLAVGCVVKHRGQHLDAQCPNHGDARPSLSVSLGTKGRDVVLHCHAGCRPDDVMQALDLRWEDFADASERDEIVATYTYHDEEGRALYRVHRTQTKRFWQERATAGGAWVSGLGDTRRVLYRLPAVAKAKIAGVPIWLTEGEKDADRLVAEGLCASCNSGGAGKFTASHADTLKGAQVVICVDVDEPGLKHAVDVQRLLIERGVVPLIVKPREGKDVSDHLAAGHRLDELIAIDPAAELREREKGADEEPWEELLPLDLAPFDEPSTFPVETLPRWIRQHVEAVARELQVPDDLPAVLALVALSVVCTGRVRVCVRGPWIEPTNLYAVVVMPPGSGKSPAVRAMMRPIEEHEAQLVAAAVERFERVEQRRRMLTIQRKRAEEKSDIEEAQRWQDELDHEPPVVSPRWLCADVTPEKLADLIAEHRGRMALVSTEGGPFDVMAGRYSDRSNLDVYLQAWSGDTLRVDRIGRPSSVVRDPLLSIGLTVQPDVIRALRDKPELQGRGLTARFMYSTPVDLVGRRDMQSIPTSAPSIVKAYSSKLTALALLASHEPITYELTPDARRLFLRWRQQLEDERGEEGELRHLREWSTKLESSVVRVAGLLAAADDLDGPIDVATIERALSIGRYWLDHARRVWAMWAVDPKLEDARAVLSSVVLRQPEFSLRELYRAQVRRFPVVDELRPVLDMLIERNYVRPVVDGPIVSRRGQPSPRFVVRPDLWTSRHDAHGAHGARLNGYGAHGAHDAQVSGTDRDDQARHGAHVNMSRVREVSEEEDLLTYFEDAETRETRADARHARHADDEGDLL